MQEMYQDGTMGETHVEKTIEDLIPHIKKSLENPKVAYVKVFRGKKLIGEEKKFVTIDEMKEKKEVKPKDFLDYE